MLAKSVCVFFSTLWTWFEKVLLKQAAKSQISIHTKKSIINFDIYVKNRPRLNHMEPQTLVV